VLGAAGIGTAVYAAARGPANDGVPAQGDPAAAAGAPSAQSAVTIPSAKCKTPKAEFITNDAVGSTTTSTTYVPVPDMTVTFKVGGSAKTCVLVDVSGYSFAPELTGSNQAELVSVTLDSTFGSPAEVQFSGDDDEDGDGAYSRQHAALFAFPLVMPGMHTVTMVFRSLNGGPVFLHRPAMKISHV
jgi:hypothetical protein